MADADAIVVLECDVPWIPKQVSPPASCKVIHMGLDPLFARYGIRNFPCDLAVPGDPAISLPMLAEALGSRLAKDTDKIDDRRRRLAEIRAAARAEIDAIYDRVRDQRPIHPAALSRAIDRIMGRRRAAISSKARPAASDGDWERRSEQSSLRRTALSSPRWATAVTCSEIQPPPISSPGPTICDPLCRDQQ